jgi:hypothetical protein
MPEIADLLDRLESVPDIMRGAPADDARLKAIENNLGVKLPDDYAAFLRRFGFALWDGGCVNGSYQMDEENLPGYDFDVVRNTLEQRRAKRPKHFEPLPKDGMVLDDDQAGGYFVLMSASSPKCRGVVYYNYEDAGGPDESWPTFADFLAERLPKPKAGKRKRSSP